MKRITHSVLSFTLLAPLLGSGAVVYDSSLCPEKAVTRIVPAPTGDPSNRAKPAPDQVGLIPGRGAWLGADGKPLPFVSDEQVIGFLRTARVVSRKHTEVGVTRPYKVLLERDGLEMHAVFRDVSVHQRMVRMSDGSTKLNFRDESLFELAAYRLSRLLGLDNVPPVVERRIGDRKGTLQAWVEGAMTEKERREKGLQAPNPLQWVRQVQVMSLFDDLICKQDRNTGNVLIDAAWKLWMIDHTRAFCRNKEPKTSQDIRSCPTGMWERLQKLDKDVVRKQMSGILLLAEVNGLMDRRDRLVELLQKLIDEKGERAVLF